MPVPEIVVRTWVPWPFWSFHTPAASVVKLFPHPNLLRSLCMTGAWSPTMKPVSRMPTVVELPPNRVRNDPPGRMRSASIRGVLWSWPGVVSRMSSTNSTKSSEEIRSMTGHVATAR